MTALKTSSLHQAKGKTVKSLSLFKSSKLCSEQLSYRSILVRYFAHFDLALKFAVPELLLKYTTDLNGANRVKIY